MRVSSNENAATPDQNNATAASSPHNAIFVSGITTSYAAYANSRHAISDESANSAYPGRCRMRISSGVYFKTSTRWDWANLKSVARQQGFTPNQVSWILSKGALAMIRSAIRPAALFVAALLAAPCALPQSKPKTKKVIFVMTDGLRWQEVFQGADAALMNKENGAVADVEGLRKTYWRESAAERRQILMPFLWNVIAKQGQIYGNREAAAEAYVTNGRNFSYPGYNETFTGFGDPRIDSNEKKYNANVTLFEWLHAKPAFKGKVAAFGAWDTFPWIINAPRAGFPVNAGYEPMQMTPMTPKMEIVNELKAEAPRDVAGESHDIYPFHTALEYWRVKKPSLLYLSLGETDHWAHGGNYTEYLRAARRVDEYVKRLWDAAQKHPDYRGVTTLVLTVDHGRGEAPVTWKGHGEKLPQSKYIWMAFLGPDTKPLGERKNIPAVTQSQIAATIAALLGEDYNAAEPKAGKPIADVLP